MHAKLNWIKGISYCLLALCLLMGTCAAYASDVAASASYSLDSLDTLPYISVNRPDMTPPEIAVAVEGDSYTVQIPDGLSVKSAALGSISMSKKGKGYTLKSMSKEGITADNLSSLYLNLYVTLKKDKAIASNITDAHLFYNYNAETGAAFSTVYVLELGDYRYVLIHYADDCYSFSMDNETKAFYDASGKRVQITAADIVVPEQLTDIEGLPEMPDDLNIDYQIAYEQENTYVSINDPAFSYDTVYLWFEYDPSFSGNDYRESGIVLERDESGKFVASDAAWQQINFYWSTGCLRNQHIRVSQEITAQERLVMNVWPDEEMISTQSLTMTDTAEKGITVEYVRNSDHGTLALDVKAHADHSTTVDFCNELGNVIVTANYDTAGKLLQRVDAEVSENAEAEPIALASAEVIAAKDEPVNLPAIPADKEGIPASISAMGGELPPVPSIHMMLSLDHSLLVRVDGLSAWGAQGAKAYEMQKNGKLKAADYDAPEGDEILIRVSAENINNIKSWVSVPVKKGSNVKEIMVSLFSGQRMFTATLNSGEKYFCEDGELYSLTFPYGKKEAECHYDAVGNLSSFDVHNAKGTEVVQYQRDGTIESVEFNGYSCSNYASGQWTDGNHLDENMNGTPCDAPAKFKEENWVSPPIFSK